jgi:hypothetical protein
MPTVDEVVATYAAAWGELDAARRQKLLEAAWSDGGTYTDPTAHVVGRDALVTHIGSFQATMPGTRIVATSAVDAHHDRLRFTWRLEGSDGASITEGIDFGELASDGRLRAIVGFFGPPPAA